MKKIQHLALALSLGLATTVSAQNIATVNGKAVSGADLTKIETNLKNQGQQVTPEIREQIKQELIVNELMRQEAEKQKVEKNPEYIKAIEQVKKNLLVEVLLANYLTNNPITDAQIQADYNQTTAALGKTEYKVSHILVETEEAAKNALAATKKSTFAEVAKKVSKDANTAANGGNLDWIVPVNLPEQLAVVVEKLPKGQTSEVIKTDYGWHIVKVDDVRALKVPALNEVREQIKNKLQQQKVFEYQKKLYDAAKIEMK